MQYKKFYLFFSLTVICHLGYTQSITDNNLFNAPVNIPMILSGNFGELRSDHFHSGIDIKTQGKSGVPIYSSSDGYISRIKISGGGYGKTLYINHPNGYTTVYAHLQNFNSDLSNYIKEIQYQNESFEVNHFPDKGELKILANELIGYSGNTGSSKGPHLHFEIRNTSNQHPLNPLFFNFDIMDNVPPSLRNLVIYPLNRSSRINGLNKKLIIPLEKKNSDFYLKTNDSLKLYGDIGFGIEMYDYLNGARNRCGIYSVDLKINDTSIYSHNMMELNFSTTRYINAHIDYTEKKKSKKQIQKLFLSPHNRLDIYNNVKNQGKYSFLLNNPYKIAINVKDSYGNTSTLNFMIMGTDQSSSDSLDVLNLDPIFYWDKANEFINHNLQIEMPPYSLYENILFNYSTKYSSEFLSPIFKVHDETIPVHKYFALSIRPKIIPLDYLDKLCIVKIDRDKEIEYIGGQFKDGFVKADVREFGEYTISIDTISPVINPIFDKNRVIESGKIKFIVKDNLSEIKSIKGYIDSQWALFEFDPKNDLVFYTFDPERIIKNQDHDIELYITDDKDNMTTYYETITW